MELVFAWINNYRNIKDIKLNFGSDYTYSIDIKREDNKCIVKRKKNEKYISNFFDPYLNLSAIVGGNAAGKSSVLEALRYIIDKKDSRIQHLLLFKAENGSLFSKSYFGKDEPSQDLSLGYMPGIPPLYLETSLDGQIIKSLEEDVTTILFSSFIDFNIYPLWNDNKFGIDISSNWLMHQDILHKDEGSNLIIEKHKYAESKRQIDFYLNNKSNIIEYLENVPDKMNVYYQHDTRRIIHDKSTVLGDLEAVFNRKFYKEQKEIKNISNVELIYRREDKYLDFLRILMHCVFKNLDTRNLKSNLEIKVKLETKDIESLSVEETVYLFFKSQNIIESEPVMCFIEVIKDEIKRSGGIYSDYFVVEINQTNKVIFDRYEDFLNVFNKACRFVYGFMSFDWRNMSTGEKAMLNLYSRFYYAKKLLLEKNQKPSTILILIDEGEVGFHLQWQKEYVKNIVRNLPKIMHDDELNIKYQLIFTTHSPLSLSDLPNDRITYLSKGKIQDLELNTFGANISDIMKNSFFLQNGIIGSYAVEKIQEVIDWLNGDSCNDIKKYELIIDAIDEPIIKRKLQDMYKKKLVDNDCISEKEIERKKVQEQIDAFKNKYNEKI